jgi:eukaryotic-like serine/threonine-protein kinase
MAITDPLVLRADVVLVPVMNLSEEVRKQCKAENGDYAITRPRSRTPSKIVNAHVAELLTEFRTAKTIVEAVISYSQVNQLDPETTLEEAFPILQQFMSSRILVFPDSEEASEIVACVGIGDHVAGFEVLRCLQVLEDTELYRVKSDSGEEAALKILPPGCSVEMERTFDREESILKYLDGRVNPKLLATGTFENRRYLAIEWCSGVPVTVAAQQVRQRGTGSAERKELLRLCCAVLEAYAHLHIQKVIHSDVHPRNILVDHNGTIKIIDFGLSRLDGMLSLFGNPHRGGIGYFFEPEYAIARLGHRHPPPSSLLGEQYALAALVYFLLTGAHYLDFSAEKREMMRQIAQDSPLPFVRRGISWPEVEALLCKALSKDPSARFNSVAEFASSLSKVGISEEQNPRLNMTQKASLDRTPAEGLLHEVLRRVRPGGPLFASGLTKAPTCSVNYGASGIAYALYRIACIRGDTALLSLADIWSTRSMSAMGNSTAFYNTEIGITLATVGQIALYHTASGVHAVQALISHAMGDMVSQQAAIDAFVLASKARCENLDLTLGRSSTLIGCSLLLDIPAHPEFVNYRPLVELGDEVLTNMWGELNEMGPIEEGTKLPYLGVAHGWAGILYAILRWCQSADRPRPVNLRERLQQLAACAEPAGQGARWKVKFHKHSRRYRGDLGSPGNYMPGWCNGSAGYVFLWTLAHRVFRDEVYLTLAQRAAWNAWQEANAIDSLCCGLAGASYGLLNLYKYTGEKEWLGRALDLANRAVIATRTSQRQDSLYKGTMGVAVLIADLHKPETACMPLFEDEGWPT